MLPTYLAREVILLQCEIICKNTPLLVKQNKGLPKNMLFQNVLKILEQPTGDVLKNDRPVNLEKIVESFGKC